MTGRCANCTWWLADSTTFKGTCHGAPPSVDPVNVKALWPVTASHEFCGAFRLSERAAGGRDVRVTA